MINVLGKTVKKTRVVNHNDYVITTEEGVEKGIFFRNPIQTVFYDTYYCDNPETSAWKYIQDIKNPVRRLYEIIIGNKNILKDIHEFEKDIDWAGFDANILCFPIYFKRNYRKLVAHSCNSDSNIQSIESYGYESEFNWCAGDCYIEKTKLGLKTGKVIRVTRDRSFYYTYEHIVRDIINTDNCKNTSGEHIK